MLRVMSVEIQNILDNGIDSGSHKLIKSADIDLFYSIDGSIMQVRKNDIPLWDWIPYWEWSLTNENLYS